MTKHPLPKDFKSYIPFICYFLLLAFLLPRAAKFDYDYRKGAPWQYETLVADFDFPIYKTEDQIVEEASRMATDVIPYYRLSEEISSKVLKSISQIALGDHDLMLSDILRLVKSVYDQGVMPEETVSVDQGTISQDLVIIQKGKRAGKYPLSSVMRAKDAGRHILAELETSYPSTNVDSVLRSSGIYEKLEPNLIYDRQTTAMEHKDSDFSISPTLGYVSAGTVIVSEQEIVTAEVAQIIDSYKIEFEENVGSDMPVAMIWLVNSGISALLALILFFAIFFSSPSLFEKKNELSYVVFIAGLAALPALIFSHQESLNAILYVPFTLVALYLQTFFDDKMTVPVFMASLMPLLVAMPQGPALYIISVSGGLVGMKLFHVFNKGWKQFLTAFTVFLVLAAAYMVMRKAGMISGYVLRDMSALFAGALLIVAGFQLTFLFEKVFGLLSSARLEELCETSNEVLRELELKAPGTFQHSLQVKNMAFACARAINADEHLVRAGAMYHDIGKMANPQCFVENESLMTVESGAKYHSGLTPQQSAHDITRHVTDGLEMADKYKLPLPVKEFIATHHGTSCTGYFYNKYVNEGGDPADKPAFSYDGRKPRTKEQLIIMLCDTVEAASRTLNSNDPKVFSDFVDAIVKAKDEEGQISESEITIKELNVVKDVLKNYLGQIYHERVVYPNRKTSR